MIEKKDRKLLVLISFFALLAVLLGYGQIKGAIYAPFPQLIIKDQQINESSIQEEIFDSLSQQDTDEDGLSDFDEIFVYGTSAYLPDTDGDGFTDKEEIEAGSDPLDPLSTPYWQPESQPETEIEEPETSFSLEEISPEEIRNFLIERGGLSPEIVDNLDDKTLIEVYNKTKQETGIDLKELGASDDLEFQFSNLEIEEIRQLLIKEGVDEEMLNSLDDSTLEQLLQETLSNF
jgi:hypothetical protein